MIRPRPAVWFEIVAARADQAALLLALARSGCVELECEAGPAACPGLRAEAIGRFRALAERYGHYWPAAARGESVPPLATEQMLLEAVARTVAWSEEAAPIVERLQALEAERASLERWRAVSAQCSPEVLGALARVGPRLQAALFAHRGALAPPAGLITQEFDSGGQRLTLAVGVTESIGALTEQVSSQHGRRFAAPPWFAEQGGPSSESIDARIGEIEGRIQAARGEMRILDERHALAEALAEVGRAAWCLGMAPGHGDPRSVLCRLQGWTSDPAGLGAALAGVRAVAGFPPAPPGSAAPLLLSNPAWVRPFELFAGLLGTPGRHSADPSMLVAVLFPLLFGYMFGDVGQGLVLAALGLLLRRRWPIARLLIAGGIASVAFGFVFGSVFSVHGALSPLWADPLSKPLPVLAVPLAGGVLLLVVGAAIAALEAYWDGRLGDWLIGEAPMLLAYLGLIAALAESGAAALAVLGLAAAAIGPALSERRVGAAWRGIGALVEKTLQMLINTLSFVRVGAFALAHAGLSAAVVALAEATDSRVGYAIVMVAGNVVVMTIEVLVVSIQTTRLLLFEFFIRFFSGQGRAFRPLAGPKDTFWEDLHEPGT